MWLVQERTWVHSSGRSWLTHLFQFLLRDFSAGTGTVELLVPLAMSADFHYARRSPTAIVTEFLNRGEKIEVDRAWARDLSALRCRWDRRIAPTGALFAVIQGDCPKADTAWWSEMNSNKLCRLLDAA
jgi:hypothetical protein